MTEAVDERFYFRHTIGGADDSICLRCFRTVAGASGQAGPREMAKLHQCDEPALYQRSLFARD
jgi:hypothetical protein